MKDQIHEKFIRQAVGLDANIGTNGCLSTNTRDSSKWMAFWDVVRARVKVTRHSIE